jgi:hypothetical protein
LEYIVPVHNLHAVCLVTVRHANRPVEFAAPTLEGGVNTNTDDIKVIKKLCRGLLKSCMQTCISKLLTSFPGVG